MPHQCDLHAEEPRDIWHTSKASFCQVKILCDGCLFWGAACSHCAGLWHATALVSSETQSQQTVQQKRAQAADVSGLKTKNRMLMTQRKIPCHTRETEFWLLIWCNGVFRKRVKRIQTARVGVGVCYSWRAWSGRLSIQCQTWVRFLPSALSTLFARRSPLADRLSPLASVCIAPPCKRRDGGSSSEQELASAPCQNHFNFTTHGTCEHDTSARWWIILSRPRPSEMNVLGPHHLILLIHSLSPGWFGFPPAHQDILSHMNPLDERLRNVQSFILDCVWPMEAYLPCARLTELSTRETAREEKRRSKTLGC